LDKNQILKQEFAKNIKNYPLEKRERKESKKY